MSISAKAAVISAIHVVAAAVIYRHLITGGWLTNRYHLNDPDMINLFLALFEPIAIIGVIAYWVRRIQSRYPLISILGWVQILIGTGFVLFFVLFALSWHPKLM